MLEALLIFRKDIRRLRWEICALLALVAWLAVFDSQFKSNSGAFGLLEFVVSFGAWFLIVLAILEEKLAGERAYWLTRPTHRTSLLIAKLLFIGSFVVLPTLLAQMATLLWHGLSPWAYRSDLLASHVSLAASLLAIAVVASVVANVPLFVSSLLGGVAIAVFGGLAVTWVFARLPRLLVARPVDYSSASYFVVCLVGIAAAAILTYHYVRRRTATARILLVMLAVFQGAAIMSAMGDSSFLGRFIPVSASPLPNGKPTLSFDPNREPPPVETSPNLVSQVRIPIRSEGLPPGMLVAGETIDYRIRSSGEFDYSVPTRRLSGNPIGGSWFEVSNGDAWLRLAVERSYEREAPTQYFHARLRLVLLDIRTVETPLPEKPTRVMKDAWCATARWNRVTGNEFGFLTFYWPFQRPDHIQVLNPPSARRYFTARNSTFLAPTLGGQTVWQETSTQIPPTPATIEARMLVARFERTLDIPSISIRKYAAPIKPGEFFEGLSQQP